MPRLVLAVLALASLAVGIDNMERPLANPDEGRYSEISREMAQTGDFVTPRLNGIKYFEKPPLQYWATAIAFKLLGANQYTASALSPPHFSVGDVISTIVGRSPSAHR